ncbi:MAG: hypothetical protein FWG16_02900 [Micrococcales bacterium]|nr:hypothetical protein [Micrococcales bacterium]
MTPSPLLLDQVAGLHLLALPSWAGPEELQLLALARWSRAALEPGKLTLSRHSSLAGPFMLDAEPRQLLALPNAVSQVWLAQTLTERGEPPYPGAPDCSGLARAFPEALPNREEGRVVSFLLAAARRLGGAVRFGNGAVISPKTDCLIDLTVYSPVWLGPEQLLAVTQPLLPQLVQAAGSPGRSPLGPAARSNPVDTMMTSQERAELHALLRQRDQALLAQGITQEAYAVEAQREDKGIVTVEVAVAAEPPRLIRQLPWAERGVVAYAIKWLPVNPAFLGMEFPPEHHVHTRRAVALEVAALAKAIQAKIGTEVLDQDGFPVSPADL